MALISCAVSTQMICIFVSAYAKFKFSHDRAEIIYLSISCIQSNLSKTMPPLSKHLSELSGNSGFLGHLLMIGWTVMFWVCFCYLAHLSR